MCWERIIEAEEIAKPQPHSVPAGVTPSLPRRDVGRAPDRLEGAAPERPTDAAVEVPA